MPSDRVDVASIARTASEQVCDAPASSPACSRYCHDSPDVTRAPSASGEHRRPVSASPASPLRSSQPLVAICYSGRRCCLTLFLYFSLPCYFVNKLHICLVFLLYCILVLPLLKFI